MTATIQWTPEVVAGQVAKWRQAGVGAIEIMAKTRTVGVPPQMVEKAIRDAAEAQSLAKLIGSNDVPVEVSNHRGVRFIWGSGEKTICVEIGRIHDLSNVAGARAEVTVEVGHGEDRLIAYGPVVLNLMKAAEISGIAGSMAELLPVVDQSLWQKYLWDACRLAVQKHRLSMSQGGTVLVPRMRGAADKAALEGFLTSRTPTILFAMPGQGKSYVALAAALAMSGSPAGGLPFAAPERRKVLYLDWETEEADQQERLYHLLGDEPAVDIGYKKMSGTLAHNLEGVLALIDAQGYDYLIIDSLLEAAGNLVEDTAVASFKSAVGETGCGSLWLAHTAKNGQGETAFGSIHWMGQSRLAWSLEQKGSDPDILAVSLVCKKDSDKSFRSSVDLSCQFVRGRYAEWCEGLVTRTEVGGELIVRMIASGQSTVEDLLAMTGLSEAVLRGRLGNLEREGRITWDGDGRWAIARGGSAAHGG